MERIAERVPQISRSGQRSMQLLGLALPPLRFKSCMGEVEPPPLESQSFAFHVFRNTIVPRSAEGETVPTLLTGRARTLFAGEEVHDVHGEAGRDGSGGGDTQDTQGACEFQGGGAAVGVPSLNGVPSLMAAREDGTAPTRFLDSLYSPRFCM